MSFISRPTVVYFMGLLAAFYMVFMTSISGLAKGIKQNQADAVAFSEELVQQKRALERVILDLKDIKAHTRRVGDLQENHHDVIQKLQSKQDTQQTEVVSEDWSEEAFFAISNYTDANAKYGAEHPEAVRDLIQKHYEADSDMHRLQVPLHRILDYVMVRDCEVKTGGKKGCIDGFVLPEQADKYYDWAFEWKSPVERPTLCETGFNAGHSAATFLLANRALNMVSFDLFIQAYSSACLAYLKAVFGKERVTVHKGDSHASLNKLGKVDKAARLQCDVVSVDGAHSFKYVGGVEGGVCIRSVIGN